MLKRRPPTLLLGVVGGVWVEISSIAGDKKTALASLDKMQGNHFHDKR
jgi:hypothetical protein